MINNYYEALEKFIDDLYSIKDSDIIENLHTALSDLCRILRIAKITMKSFNGYKQENENIGITKTIFDSNMPSIEKITNRYVTQGMTIVIITYYAFENESEWIKEEYDRIERITKILHVFTSRKKLSEIAEKYTFYDDDGYHNSRYFVRFAERLNYESLLQGKVAIHFNLKHFSLINQQLGRSTGTLVMRRYVQDIASAIAGKGIVCRPGGDNFTILAEKTELDKIIHLLNGTNVVFDNKTGESVRVTATAGIYMIPDNIKYEDITVIIDKITTAAQIARTNEKEDIVYFKDSMFEDKDKIATIQKLFPDALENEEFLVYYQPKISLETEKISGAEALCRWKHNGEIIPPINFIPILERNLNICKLDFYMLDHVCKDIRKWLDEGKEVVRISVNLSRKHIMDESLLKKIIEIVDSNNVPHEYIEIELTETTTDVEFRDLKNVVMGLQQEGIFTSVDDFGIGYSSLNLIKEIPWNVLKVDRSFLPIDTDDEFSNRSIMFKYVVAMAREMGLECIAEGVETESQVNILKENSCEFAQGFYFDKPLPVDEFEKRFH